MPATVGRTVRGVPGRAARHPGAPGPDTRAPARCMRSSPLWEPRDRLLQQLDRGLVAFFQGGNPAEAEIAHRRGGRIGSERFVESSALGDLPRVEQGIGQLHAGRFVVRRRGDGILEPGHGLGAAGHPLQHQRIQVVPDLEGAGCQRLRAGVRSVRSLGPVPTPAACGPGRRPLPRRWRGPSLGVRPLKSRHGPPSAACRAQSSATRAAPARTRAGTATAERQPGRRRDRHGVDPARLSLTDAATARTSAPIRSWTAQQ